ncbi:MAG: transcriptional repressor [Peptococcaceae bacterium]|nr:transcriptional repressor [Peptococcaceae bacterium]
MDSKSHKELLSQHGIKNTRQRLLTLDILTRTETPQSAEHIYLQIKKMDSTISLSTVYRILDVFIEKRLATKITGLQGGRAAFELNHMQHRHHLTCVGCKRTVVIESCPLESYVSTLERTTSFSITGHRLEMYGLCIECK